MDSKQHVAQVIREESSHYSVPDAIVEAVLDRLLPSIRMLPQHPEEADAARVVPESVVSPIFPPVCFGRVFLHSRRAAERILPANPCPSSCSSILLR